VDEMAESSSSSDNEDAESRRKNSRSNIDRLREIERSLLFDGIIVVVVGTTPFSPSSSPSSVSSTTVFARRSSNMEHRSSAYPMLPVPEALEIVLQHCPHVCVDGVDGVDGVVVVQAPHGTDQSTGVSLTLRRSMRRKLSAAFLRAM